MSLSAIASKLGLSVTTVSRALGGYDDVAATTRARIEAEAGRSGYHANPAARRLRRRRSEAVGVVLPSGPGQFDDPFFLRLLSAIGPALQAGGLDLLVTTARPGAEEMRAYRHLVEAGGGRAACAGPCRAARRAQYLGQPVRAALDRQAEALKRVIEVFGAPCWTPDAPSKGLCPVH